jgi:hypothetical protein
MNGKEHLMGQISFYTLFFPGLELARQVLYHLSHTPTPFCFSYFSNKVSHLCPQQAWAAILLFMLPAVAGVHLCAQLLVEMGFHKLFTMAGLKTQSSRSPPSK